MSRITSKDFLQAVQTLENTLKIKLTTNIWHKHYSVYTEGESGICQKLLVSSNTARDACDQIWAILNVLGLQQNKD